MWRCASGGGRASGSSGVCRGARAGLNYSKGPLTRLHVCSIRGCSTLGWNDPQCKGTRPPNPNQGASAPFLGVGLG
eukprot:7435115-Alexandrium_andersonii.AAC.1